MESRVGMFFLVLLFGGSVAALGVQDIYRHHGDSDGDGKKQIVEDLYGAHMIERAQFSPKRYAEEKAEHDKVTKSDRQELKKFLSKLVP